MQGTVFAANTLEELAELLGYTGDAATTFVESVEHYNELCNSADGDTDYGKDKAFMQAIDTPPFYGGTSELSHETKPNMVTMSGLITDETQNVLRKDDWDAHQGPVRCRQLPRRALRLRLQHAVRRKLHRHGAHSRLAGRPHSGEPVATTATFLPPSERPRTRGLSLRLGGSPQHAAPRRGARCGTAAYRARFSAVSRVSRCRVAAVSRAPRCRVAAATHCYTAHAAVSPPPRAPHHRCAPRVHLAATPPRRSAALSRRAVLP